MMQRNECLLFSLFQVTAIHPKRMLAFLNHFIIHTTRFLNKFSCVCEQVLSKGQDFTVFMLLLENYSNILYFWSAVLFCDIGSRHHIQELLPGHMIYFGGSFQSVLSFCCYQTWCNFLIWKENLLYSCSNYVNSFYKGNLKSSHHNFKHW